MKIGRKDVKSMVKDMISRDEEFKKLKEEYKMTAVPQEGMAKIEEAVWRAKMDKKREKKRKIFRNAGICAAAALLLVGLPNVNADIAYAMGNIPVLGKLFQVVTIRSYNYDDGNNDANVEVPNISISSGVENQADSMAISEVNKSIDEYITELTEEFNRDMTEDGHTGLDVSYEVVTDTDDWFTLKITALETKASGYEFYRYYHIDKKNDKAVQLKDLFAEDSDYVQKISAEIKKQMKEQMEAGTSMYFIEEEGDVDGFSVIDENQNFYRNAEGSLVIVFDEYEVGPGYIGCPEFVIPDGILQ